MQIEAINNLSAEEAYAQIEQSCCAPRWVQAMVDIRPFTSLDDMRDKAARIWDEMGERDYLEAFDGHPKIGDVNSLKAKYANTQGEASHEQSGVNEASDQVIQALAQGNSDYEDKFGFIFIVCATGKSAQQMLDLLLARLVNTRKQELINAAAEQAKITDLRLQKLLED